MSFNASSVNPAEIERIVRDVLRNLSGLSSAGSHGSNGTAASLANVAIAIDASVVSVDVLRRLKLPASEKKIQIQSSSVLTPSARDWCRERGIEIVRSPSSGTSKSPAGHPASIATSSVSSNVESASHAVENATKPRRLFIAGSCPWISSLE
ncbi:MAG: hypothetical protein FJ308_14875, partial [Planctomycetes bacterium]|nr:hypothetical protein [Planctomycetota bacterium]